MLTVERCCCFQLETGGLILAWLTTIGNIIGAILCFVGIIMSCFIDCKQLAQYADEEAGCSVIRGILIAVLVFALVLGIGFAFIGYKCIQGIRARDHFRVKPLMILFAIFAVLSLFQIFTLTAQGIVQGLFNAAINGYFFVVMFSLYDLLKREYETGANRQYLQPGKV